MVLDLDYIYDENDKKIFWVSSASGSFSKYFEQKYKEEIKATKKFRNSLKMNTDKNPIYTNISASNNINEIER